MAEDDENTAETPDRTSIDSWLNTVLPATKSPAEPAPEREFEPQAQTFKYQLGFKTDFKTPADSTLSKIEVREVPAQVYAGSGEMIEPGTWAFECDHLDSVSFYTDSKEGLRQSTTVVGKFSLKRDEDDREWSELETSQLVIIDNAVEEVSESADTVAPQTSTLDSCIASLIDLEVNIEAPSDSESDETIVRFSGLAPGAKLTKGQIQEDGTWIVHQSDLNGLGIIVPDHTPAFDLKLTLGSDSDDGDDDAAIINVDVPNPIKEQDGDKLMLRFSASSAEFPHRIRLFADGVEFYDRVILWGDDPDIPVDMMVTLPSEDGIPFELLIREETLLSTTEQPATLLALELNDDALRLDGESLRGNIISTASGISWNGDLILSTREFEKQNVADAPNQTPKQTPKQTPSHPLSEPEYPQEDHEEDEHPEDDDPDVLVIRLSSSDIDQAGFVEELRALQSFIHETGESEDEITYERLGLTIKNFRDISVLGPTNAEVDLNPGLPMVAPVGGRDNALQTISLSAKSLSLNDYDSVEIHGLPPGCMITHGKNMGDGCWHLKCEDMKTAKLIGQASTSAKIARVYAQSPGLDQADDTRITIGDILVGGASRRVMSPVEDSILIGINLDAQTFDPNGLGTLSLTIGDVPSGILLTGGANHGDGIWTCETKTGSDLGFHITKSLRAFSVSMTCVAIDEETGDSTVVTHQARIRPDRMEVILDQAVSA